MVLFLHGNIRANHAAGNLLCHQYMVSRITYICEVARFCSLGYWLVKLSH